MRKLVCTIMILFTCFSGSVVLATTVYPAVGGQWNYGVGITGSYSDYMHGQKIHTATVSHPEATPSMARAPANSWAQARLTKYSSCSFYYGVE